ncbi:MAG: hypothetical protein HY606_13425, partial [Planctomycetes bacterium]|nr:hypothetical protein [Planctomycetota bacterium]
MQKYNNIRPEQKKCRHSNKFADSYHMLATFQKGIIVGFILLIFIFAFLIFQDRNLKYNEGESDKIPGNPTNKAAYSTHDKDDKTQTGATTESTAVTASSEIKDAIISQTIKVDVIVFDFNAHPSKFIDYWKERKQLTLSSKDIQIRFSIKSSESPEFHHFEQIFKSAPNSSFRAELQYKKPSKREDTLYINWSFHDYASLYDQTKSGQYSSIFTNFFKTFPINGLNPTITAELETPPMGTLIIEKNNQSVQIRATSGNNFDPIY